MKIKYKKSAILERLVAIISEFSENRTSLTDDEIGDLRASLAAGSYIFAEQIVQTEYLAVLEATMAYERAEGETFEQELGAAINEGWSRSQAIDIARKTSRTNVTYAQAFNDLQTAKTHLNIHNMLLSQINQVLNAMSKRS